MFLIAIILFSAKSSAIFLNTLLSFELTISSFEFVNFKSIPQVRQVFVWE